VWKISRLAEQSGLTVRTLRHYDSIGLLRPSHRSEAGYRLYDDRDVERLARILALRSLGMSLSDIQRSLNQGCLSLIECLEAHAATLDDAIARQRQSLTRTADLLNRLRADPSPSMESIQEAMEVIRMFEKYYSPEQLEQLRKRADQVGPERIQQVQQEWTELFAAYRQAQAEGLAVDSPQVQALASKSRSLIAEFTGGDAGIEQSLGNLYQGEGPQQVLEPHGYEMDEELWTYMSRAQQAAEQ